MKNTILISLFAAVMITGLLSCTKQIPDQKTILPTLSESYSIKDSLAPRVKSEDIIDYEEDFDDPENGGAYRPGLHGSSQKGMFVHMYSPLQIRAYFERLPDGKYNVTLKAIKESGMPVLIENIIISSPLISHYFSNGFRVHCWGRYISHLSADPNDNNIYTTYFETEFDVIFQ